MDEEEILEQPIPETTAEPIEEPEVQEAQPEEAPVEPESPKHPLFERYKDKNFASDEEYLNAALSDLASSDEYRTENESKNQLVVDAFMAEPGLASVVLDVTKGYDMLTALALNIPKEDLMAAYDQAQEISDEQLQQSIAERKQKQAETEAFLSQIASNIEKSRPEIDEFMQETGYNEQQAAEFLTKANEFFDKVYRGEITKETMKQIKKMIDYESDIANAEETAEIRGRNANIELQIEKENKAGGDGLPKIASMGAAPEPPKPQQPGNPLSEVVEYQKKRNVF